MIKQLELINLCDICENNFAVDVENNFGYKVYWCEDCIETQEEKSYWDV